MSSIKATVGKDHQFVWVAPGYVDPDAQTVADQLALTVRYAAGNVAVTLTPLVATAATITATSGRVLTASQAPNAASAAGDLGVAFFKADQCGVIPVRVVDVSGTAITLADIPKTLPTAPTNGRLVWATWQGTIASHAAERDVPWSVAYIQGGTGITAQARQDEGTISWVRQPFSTGLTHDKLCQLRPELAPNVPDGQQGHHAIIDAAELELVAYIRDLWSERGLWEDNIIGCPAGLQKVHAEIAAALYYDDVKPARAESIRTRLLGPVLAETGRRTGGGLLDSVLRTVAVDTDANGTVDDSRDRATGNRANDSTVSITASTARVNTRRHSRVGYGFTVGEPH